MIDTDPLWLTICLTSGHQSEEGVGDDIIHRRQKNMVNIIAKARRKKRATATSPEPFNKFVLVRLLELSEKRHAAASFS